MRRSGRTRTRAVRRTGRALATIGLAAVAGFGLAGTASAATAVGPPHAVTAAVTGVGPTSATLYADVEPGGSSTRVYFKYGTSTAYGQQTITAEAGAGIATVTVRGPLIGLIPGVTYHYRVVASNRYGTRQGTDRTFTTNARFTAVTGTVTVGQSGTATFTGTVNPAGDPTTASFRYGAGTTGSQSTQAVAVGSGSKAVAVNTKVMGLTPGSTYHYQLVATNRNGTTNGADRTFVVPGPTPSPSPTPSPTSSLTPTSSPTPTPTPTPAGTPTTGPTLNPTGSVAAPDVRGTGPATPGGGFPIVLALGAALAFLLLGATAVLLGRRQH